MSKKYLFVINTKIASLVSNLVIHHLQLDIRNCYFVVSRDDMHLLSEAMLPDNAIFIDDISNLLLPCEQEFDCYRYTACVQHLIKRVTQAIGSLEFTFFTPGIDNFISYALASSPLCQEVHIIEQGMSAYEYNVNTLAYNLDPEVIEAKYEEFFTQNPTYHYSNTGVANYVPLPAYAFNSLDNPIIAEQQKHFYRLNRQAFVHVEKMNQQEVEFLAEEFNTSVDSLEDFKYKYTTFDLEQVKQSYYQGPLLQIAQQYQSDLTYFHVLAIDPLYHPRGEILTERHYELYANHIRSLLARVQHQYQAEMLFVRFTKGQSARERQIVTDLLDETDFYFLILEDEFNLELEFALAPARQFIVHGISSELLIYAQTFQQIACEYIDLVIYDNLWNGYLNERQYYIKTVLGNISSESNVLTSVPYHHLFLVTSEVSLATALTLIKQFDLNTDQCFILTDSKHYPKISAIFNENQVMMIDDFEVIYAHVNDKCKVINYLNAATYVNGVVNKFLHYNNYSFYTDSMDSYLSMQLASHFRCQEVNFIESGISSAQINNDFGLPKAHSFFDTLRNKFPQQLPHQNAVLTENIVSYCFRLRKYAFTQSVIHSPMMLINLQVKQLRELNLYNQIIEPVDGSDRIHLLVIENNQADYPFLHQYLTDYATVLRSLEDRHLNHLYIMLIQPNINVFNQLKNLIIATGIPCSLFYNIDLFSELFYANKQVRLHTMSPRIAALAQFSQQAFTLYQNTIPVNDHEELPNIAVRTTLTDVILDDLGEVVAEATDVPTKDQLAATAANDEVVAAGAEDEDLLQSSAG